MSYSGSRLGASAWRVIRRCGLGLLIVGANGCVLAESADNYPFNPILEFVEGDEGMPPEEDLPTPEPPVLIFTELLIDAPGVDSTVTERGEYIEIKNIGDGPADPREITMFLRDLDNPLGGSRISVQEAFGAEEKEIVDGLEDVLPGEYFVFIRYEDSAVAPISDELRPGYSYDYGRFANGPTLPHQQGIRRQLDLGYTFANGESQIFDGVRWDGHEFLDPVGTGKSASFSEGEAIAVDSGSEDAESNNAPDNWCTPPDLVGEVNGTPGRPASCG